MSTSEQRSQWAQHIADESRALELQQRSAGDTHAPTETPQPYTVDQLEAAVAAAVTEERQRCAGIAETWSLEARLAEHFAGFTEGELRAAAAAARAIAGEIRHAEPPPAA